MQVHFVFTKSYFCGAQLSRTMSPRKPYYSSSGHEDCQGCEIKLNIFLRWKLWRVRHQWIRILDRLCFFFFSFFIGSVLWCLGYLGMFLFDEFIHINAEFWVKLWFMDLLVLKFWTDSSLSIRSKIEAQQNFFQLNV